MPVQTSQRNKKRTLYHLPIIHTHTDLGKLNEPVLRASLNKMGLSGLKRKMDIIDHIWSRIEQFVKGLKAPFEALRLYQDGLPVCGREEHIVRDLANAGSRNHRLLLRLMDKGAILMGTESAELLVEEYGLYNRMLETANSLQPHTVKTLQKDLSDSILEKRDLFIAERINSTLQSGDIGILFLGMLHSVEKFLNKKIRVLYPVGRPMK